MYRLYDYTYEIYKTSHIEKIYVCVLIKKEEKTRATCVRISTWICMVHWRWRGTDCSLKVLVILSFNIIFVFQITFIFFPSYPRQWKCSFDFADFHQLSSLATSFIVFILISASHKLTLCVLRYIITDVLLPHVPS